MKVNRSTLPIYTEFFAICTGFCCVSKIYFRETGKKAYRQN